MKKKEYIKYLLFILVCTTSSIIVSSLIVERIYAKKTKQKFYAEKIAANGFYLIDKNGSVKGDFTLLTGAPGFGMRTEKAFTIITCDGFAIHDRETGSFMSIGLRDGSFEVRLHAAGRSGLVESRSIEISSTDNYGPNITVSGISLDDLVEGVIEIRKEWSFEEDDEGFVTHKETYDQEYLLQMRDIFLPQR